MRERAPVGRRYSDGTLDPAILAAASSAWHHASMNFTEDRQTDIASSVVAAFADARVQHALFEAMLKAQAYVEARHAPPSGSLESTSVVRANSRTRLPVASGGLLDA